MSSEFNAIIFKKKTFSDVLQDIYNNSTKTEKQISDLINSLKDHIDGPGSAAIIVPLIAQYLDVKVKNDEHLVKMAAIVQRVVANSTNSVASSLIFTPEEENALFEELKLLQNKTNNAEIKVVKPVSLIKNE